MYGSIKLNPRRYKPNAYGNYGSAYGGDEPLTLTDLYGYAAQYAQEKNTAAAQYLTNLYSEYAASTGQSVEEVQEAAEAAVVGLQPCIRKGAKGPAVRLLVEKITDTPLGKQHNELYDGAPVSEGIAHETFGKDVDYLVRAWQFMVFGSEDGVAGPDTWAKLGLKGAPCPKKKKKRSGSSSSGSSSNGSDSDIGLFSKVTDVTDEPWFWPVVGGVAFVGLVFGVKQLKKKKKKTNRRRRRRNFLY